MKVKISEEESNAILDEFLEQMKISSEKRKEIFSNTNYLKWLERFTIEHQSFSDDDWLYFPKKY